MTEYDLLELCMELDNALKFLGMFNSFDNNIDCENVPSCSGLKCWFCPLNGCTFPQLEKLLKRIKEKIEND